jgi:preprotein translocase subunit SecG
MVSILAFVHVVLSLFLVALVLIQDPKGGGAGGLFGGGGGSNSLFGATGAPSFLARLTRWVAVVFAGSCIAMTIFIKPDSSSVLDQVENIPAATAPMESGQETPAVTNKAEGVQDAPEPAPEQ